MKRIIATAFAVCITLAAFATHSLGGEITYRHLQGNDYEITIITYSDAQSPADRDSLYFTLTSCSDLDAVLFEFSVARTSIKQLSSIYQKNEYKISSLTMPGNGCFRLQVTDPNRINGIDNITGAVTTPVYLHSDLYHDIIYNNSAVFNSFPIIKVAINDTVKMSASAYDPDGNCLKYELIAPKESPVSNVPGYWFPDNNPLGGTNIFAIDSVSGEITAYFSHVGIYSYAVRVSEWENNQLMGYVVRDMIVEVVNPSKQVVFDSLSTWNQNAQGVYEYTVLPGSTLSLDLLFRDNDNQNNQQLKAYGEVFGLSNPASFSVNNIATDEEFGTFSWTPIAADQRTTPYVINFRGATQIGTLQDSLYEEKTLIIYTSTTKADCYSNNVGVDDPENDIGLTAYPNPFSEECIIVIDDIINGRSRVTLYDISGRIIQDFYVSNTNRITIENKNMAPGVYFYTIITDKGTNLSGKVIVQ